MKLFRTLRLSFWILLTIFALSSCSKDSGDTPSGNNSGGIGGIGGIGGGGTGGGGTGGGGTGGGGTGGGSKTQMLTAKNWTAVSIKINPGIDVNQDGTPDTDLTPFYDTCTMDDFLKYNADQTYKIDEGATKCDPNSPQVYESGTWSWASGETQLTMTVQGDSYSVMVTALTAQQFVTSQQVQFQDGSTHTLTIIYN